jgi:TolA-binding protein
MTSATLEATVGLFDRFESELKALEARQRAAVQTLHATEQTQTEMQGRVAELLVELKTAEGKVAEAQEHARQITANAERQAYGIVRAATLDADATRERMRTAIEAMKRTLEGVS